MNPRFYDDYRIAMRTQKLWIPEELRFEHRVYAVDDEGKVLLGAKSFSGYEGAMQLLGDFLDGELARRGVPLED